ncbi:hypothetical protein PV08_02607 [Exophiala spinifera]|uniref:Uncharacterized protein n=1 Tax=Exophiala spinifera TaxID=91928 RepID=A0A0D2C3V1_9EURO|nr:uncharacterized protein PV08_02607 [Exophiala spinifera]KIW18319.1 hypothetical protein PV08_02607 [Exophiala spinifera]
MPLPSPLSPRSAAVEPGSAAPSPVVALFSSSSHNDSVTSNFALTSPTWAPANHSLCRRNSLATPVTSPQQASFLVRTPEQAYFQRPPMSSNSCADGRQSRLSLRSSAGIDRVLALPLRIDTSFYDPPSQDEDVPPSTALFRSEKMDWTPDSLSSPPSRSPRLSHTDNHTRSRSRSRSLSTKAIGSGRSQPLSSTSPRSPIRKRQQRSARPHLSSLVLPPPPRYHVIVSDHALSPDSLRARIQYVQSVQHLRAPLVPLISVSTGLPHPSFPTNLLQYHLLTHDQLDSLARWYHQVTPAVDETFMYPGWIPAWTSLDEEDGSGASVRNNVVLDNVAGEGEGVREGGVDLETKRRRFGRFIGLRGCESPVPSGPEDETPSELARRMEREWRRALEKAEDDERMWEKSWRGRW